MIATVGNYDYILTVRCYHNHHHCFPCCSSSARYPKLLRACTPPGTEAMLVQWPNEAAHMSSQNQASRSVLSAVACGCCRFRTDGSIVVGVQAGGYMETLFWEYPGTAGDLPFGTVVQRNVLANLHDHLAGV